MTHYFCLQRTLLDRRLLALGIRPWVGYLVGSLLLVGLCLLLLERSEYAAYAIVAVGWSLVLPLGERRRNDFLQITFPDETYRRLRLTENGIVSFPFMLILFSSGFWALALVQGIVGVLLSLLPVNVLNAKALPTPFSSYPFESAIGFRKSLPLLAVAVFLLVMGVRADNFELSAFSFFLPAFIAQGWYGSPEPGGYVYAHTFLPRPFLNRKLKIGLGQLALLLLPFLLTLLIVFPERWWWSLLLLVLALAYLGLMIVAKYADYPEEISISRGFLIALGMLVFPALLFIIPFLYRRAVSRLYLVLP
jgi:hypothetical protein